MDWLVNLQGLHGRAIWTDGLRELRDGLVTGREAANPSLRFGFEGMVVAACADTSLKRFANRAGRGTRQFSSVGRRGHF